VIWTAFVLLVMSVLIGGWCIHATVGGTEYWRVLYDANPNEVKLACWAAALMLVVAMGFAMAAYLAE